MRESDRNILHTKANGNAFAYVNKAPFFSTYTLRKKFVHTDEFWGVREEKLQYFTHWLPHLAFRVSSYDGLKIITRI